MLWQRIALMIYALGVSKRLPRMWWTALWKSICFTWSLFYFVIFYSSSRWKFDILSDILNEPFIVTNPVGESVVAKRVYRNCPIMFLNTVDHVELVELVMFDINVILGMDWWHACFASKDCRTRVVKLTFQMKPFESGRGEILFLEFLSYLLFKSL